MQQLKQLFLFHEDWLIEQTLNHAKQHGYAKYTSTLYEAWHVSIAGLTNALIEALDTFGLTGYDFTPEDTFENDSISAFAITESRLHRERGVSLGMFLGLLKYYRRTYIGLTQEAVVDPIKQKEYRAFVAQFFDRLEIALCVDWTKAGDQEVIATMQARNRGMTNEKNRFLTLFESLTTPIFILDQNLNIERINRAAVALLGKTGTSEKLAYARYNPLLQTIEATKKKVALKDVALWLTEAMSKAYPLDTGLRDCNLEATTPLSMGSRHFTVSISEMADISNKFAGFSLVLDDITNHVRMQQQIVQERNRAKHYLEIVASILVVLDVSGMVTLINKTGCMALGYAENELMGHSWIDVAIPDDQRDDVADYFYRIFSGDAELEDEHTNEVLTKNGERKLISWRNQLLRNEDGIPIGILSSGIDITEQRAAEEALAEKEIWLRNTFLALGEAVLILSPDLIVIDANPAAEAMFQMTNEEIANISSERLHVDQAHAEEFNTMSKQAFTQNTTAEFEFFMRRKNGEIFPTEHSVSLITGDDGLPLGLVSVIRDISERKSAEQKLMNSEEKFRRIFETIEEGYIIADMDGIIQMVNPATSKLLGYSNSELNGKDLGLLYSSQDERMRLRSTLATKGAVRGFHLTAKHKNGSTIVVEANAHMLLDENGVPTGMEGTFRDITERIEADKILHERERQYRAFFENNHAIMLLVDPKYGTILDANPAAVNFYGYPKETICLMTMSEISAQTDEEIFQEMVKAGKEKRGYLLQKHRLATKETRDVEVYSGPINVRGNQLLYSIIHDVTERARLERDMTRMATTDALTGVNNRHQFFIMAEQVFKRASRYDRPLTVLMLDIDYFKSINDTHGHQTGDVVLKALSTMALTTLRETDIFGRLGGEEFAAVLPETGMDAAMQVAERMRSELARLKVRIKDGDVSFTVSIGVSRHFNTDKAIEDTINRADEALYKAKRMGRNRVEKS